MAPHIYGPSISHRDQYSGAFLFNAISTSVGYLSKQGFCQNGGACQTFPIVIGETGSALTDGRDFDFYTSLIQYISNSGPGNDGRHADISSVFWWSFNSNSGFPLSSLNNLIYHMSKFGSNNLYKLLKMSSSKLTLSLFARFALAHMGCWFVK